MSFPRYENIAGAGGVGPTGAGGRWGRTEPIG